MEYLETQAEKEAYYKAYKKKLNEILEDPMLKYLDHMLFEIMKVACPLYILCDGGVTRMVFDSDSQVLVDKITTEREKYVEGMFNKDDNTKIKNHPISQILH
jgi:hypothetical protein